MSSNFLQRFKGKTQSITKDGVHNILGGGRGNDVQVFTHSNGISMNQKANTSKTSNLNPSKKSVQQSAKKTQSMNKTATTDNRKLKKSIVAPSQQKSTSNENPFLISNPFYLDQQQRLKEQQERKQRQRFERLQKQKKKQKEDPKKGTYASSMGSYRNSQNKKSEKEWVKLGGLGPNIGGQQWEQRRKKQQKMQEFANQVKVINSQKVKVPKPVLNKKQQKRDNPRTKALQYSKNVPKPVIKQFERQEQQLDQQPIRQISQNQLSELQLYELRHKQLKQMLKKDF